MRRPQSDAFREYATTALCRILVTIIVAQLISLVTAAPTTLTVPDLASLEPGQQVGCSTGCAILDPETEACACPRSTEFRWFQLYDYLTQLLPSTRSLTRQRLRIRQAGTTDSNSSTTTSSTGAPEITSFIPPPKTDITSALIQQSLSQQPQTLGQISSVQPFFRDGAIQFTMNLVGSAGSHGMRLNASNKIPVLTIGENIEPALIIVPQEVKNGSEMTTTDFATIVAVNMYSKEYMTFWIMLNNGTMISLLSDCKVHGIDRIDPSTSAVTVMPSSSTGMKRNTRATSATIYQYGATEITRRASAQVHGHARAAKRGITGVNVYNTKMTQSACAAMECTINGEKPLWNIFTRNCYCETSPSYWAVNPSAVLLYEDV